MLSRPTKLLPVLTELLSGPTEPLSGLTDRSARSQLSLPPGETRRQLSFLERSAFWTGHAPGQVISWTGHLPRQANLTDRSASRFQRFAFEQVGVPDSSASRQVCFLNMSASPTGQPPRQVGSQDKSASQTCQPTLTNRWQTA